MAQAATKPKAEPAPKRVLMKDFQLSEFVYGRLSVTLPVGWTFEDTLEPEFWANVAHTLAPKQGTADKPWTGSIIEVRTVDHRFYGELYVRAVFKQGLVVEPLGPPVQLVKTVKSASKKFKTRFNVAKQGYDVIRESDGEIIMTAEDCPTEEIANEAIRQLVAG